MGEIVVSKDFGYKLAWTILTIVMLQKPQWETLDLMNARREIELQVSIIGLPVGAIGEDILLSPPKEVPLSAIHIAIDQIIGKELGG